VGCRGAPRESARAWRGLRRRGSSTDGTIVSAVGDYTVQTYAKAYPTIRELTLAKMMGAQGVVASLCPIHTEDSATGDDPLYGYRPALDALVDRMVAALPPAP
jgi:hypothetical protein